MRAEDVERVEKSRLSRAKTVYEDQHITLKRGRSGNYYLRGNKFSGPALILRLKQGRIRVIPADADVETFSIEFVRP